MRVVVGGDGGQGHGVALPRQRRDVELAAVALDDADVGGHAVAHRQVHDVAHHQRLGGHAAHPAAAEHARRRLEHLLEGRDDVRAAFLLRHREEVRVSVRPGSLASKRYTHLQVAEEAGDDDDDEYEQAEEKVVRGATRVGIELNEVADNAQDRGHPQQHGEGTEHVLAQQPPPRRGRNPRQCVGTVVLEDKQSSQRDRRGLASTVLGSPSFAHRPHPKPSTSLVLVQANIQVGAVANAQLRQRDAVVVVRLVMLQILEGVIVRHDPIAAAAALCESG